MASVPPAVRSTVNCVYRLLYDPKLFWTLASLVIVGDAFLTALITRFVPYTEIDWETYMVHVKQMIGGEKNYAAITGPTGGMVYPAGHAHIHRFLYAITNEGKDIATAQAIYGALYLGTLVLTCAIYRKAGGIPNWIVLLLPLSKRLHSIYALRLFNDCWAVFATQAAILLFQYGVVDRGILLFSAALSVKMSVFLYLPGLLVVLFKKKGLLLTLTQILNLVVFQGLIGTRFLREDPWAYLNTAFNFGRVFLYKWTVNWRMFDEEAFLEPRFARLLLLGHVATLVAFGLYKWCKPDGGVLRVLVRGFQYPIIPPLLSVVTPDYIATVLFTSNLIGIIFARSLHYQFYSWYAQQLPFLAWRTKYPVPVKLALLAGIEYAWNVFPSTPLSSTVLLVCNVTLLVGVWFGYPFGKEPEQVEKKQD